MPVKALKSFITFLTISWACLVNQSLAQEAVFQNWSVNCSNDFCRATTNDQRGLTGNLVLERFSDKKAPWTFSLELPDTSERLEPKNLRVAGHRPADVRRKRDFTFSEGHGSINFTNSGTIQLIFRRIVEGRRFFIDFRNAENQIKRASFSLNGLSSALLYIDEKQNRIASRREIGLKVIRKTKAKKSAEELAFHNHQKTLDADSCNLKPEEIYAIGLSVEKLDDENQLVIIPCYRAAYNSGARLFLVNEEAQKAIVLLWASYTAFTGWNGTDILSNVYFDNQTKEISMLRKARGIGDCGISARWQWQKDGFFKMMEYRSKEACNGALDDWPIIFPALSNPEN